MKNNGAIVRVRQSGYDQYGDYDQYTEEQDTEEQGQAVTITTELLNSGFIIIVATTESGEESFFYDSGTLKLKTPKIGTAILDKPISRERLIGNQVIVCSVKSKLIEVAKEYIQEKIIHSGKGNTTEHILLLALDIEESIEKNVWAHLLNEQHTKTNRSFVLDALKGMAAEVYSKEIENIVGEPSLISVSANPGSQYAQGDEESLFTSIDIQEDLWKRDDKYPGDDDEFISRREKDAINQREKDRKLGSNKYSPKGNAYPKKSQPNDDSDVIDVEYKESKDSKTEPKPDNVKPDATKATVQPNGVSTPPVNLDEPTKGQPAKEVTPDPSPIIRIKDTLVWGVQVVLIFLGYIGLSLLFAALSGSLIPVVTNIFFPIIIGIAAVISRGFPWGPGSR